MACANCDKKTFLCSVCGEERPAEEITCNQCLAEEAASAYQEGRRDQAIEEDAAAGPAHSRVPMRGEGTNGD